MFKTDFARTVAIAALTLVTSATFVLGAVGPAQAGFHPVAAARSIA